MITGLILLAIAATSGSAYMDNDVVASNSFYAWCFLHVAGNLKEVVQYYKHVREGRTKRENRESREDKEEEGGGGIPYCYL